MEDSTNCQSAKKEQSPILPNLSLSQRYDSITLKLFGTIGKISPGLVDWNMLSKLLALYSRPLPLSKMTRLWRSPGAAVTSIKFSTYCGWGIDSSAGILHRVPVHQLKADVSSRRSFNRTF